MTVASANIVDSGYCGDPNVNEGKDVTWTLDENGTLTVSGNGAMENYNIGYFLSTAPWGSSKAITSVVIENGVTSIGRCAFHNCANLSSVKISDTVTEIQGEAFSECPSITSIIVPGNVISIGEDAFHLCEALSSVTLTNGLTSVSSEAFASTALTSITIPASVSQIDWRAFGYTWDESKYYENYNDPYVKVSGFTIYGWTGSEAEKYANENGFKFVPVGSGSGAGSSGSSEGVTIRAEKTTIEVGEDDVEVSLTVTGASLMDGDVTWTSSNPEVLTVSANVILNGSDHASATVKGISEGKATVTATTKDGKTASLEITVTVPQSKIALFTTEKTLTIEPGQSMKLGFGRIVNNKVDGDWVKMAIVVSNPSVISVSDYSPTDYGYAVDVTGKKEGSSNLTITDSETGANLNLVITVKDFYSDRYSYYIENMATFYPNNSRENDIKTNIYNLNGLYVNNYSFTKTGTGYTVSFDAYNTQYHTAAVDIYDAKGNWLDCEEIKKYKDVASLYDVGEQTFFLVTDLVTGRLLTYEQRTGYSKLTSHVSFHVPEGGYFTISNNFADSPGTFLFNSIDICFEALYAVLDFGTQPGKEKKLSEFTDLLKEELINDKNKREEFQKVLKKSLNKHVKDISKKILNGQVDDGLTSIAGTLENVFSEILLDWKQAAKTAVGAAESWLEKLMGPFGTAIKGCFEITKLESLVLQAYDIAASVNAPFATVYSSIPSHLDNPYGVDVDTQGNIDSETELHVFRVSNNDSFEVVLDGDESEYLKKYVLYNICFVKDDKLVQPNGRVTVRIPIPDDLETSTCAVYRQEDDGSWTLIEAHVEGNYLVFETDHFSLYGILGQLKRLSVSSLPDKLTYHAGEVLNIEGLSLLLGDDLITSGFLCEPMVLSKVGKETITVSYGGASTEFEVNVEASNSSPKPDYGIIPDVPWYQYQPENEGEYVPGPDEVTYSFPDVDPNAWYAGPVGWAAQSGVTAGYPDGNFHPDDTCTRAQIVTFLWKAAGTPMSVGTTSFSDVEQGSFYYDAAVWAANSGIIAGYPDGNFHPDDPCTRAQIVAMLYRFANSPAVSGESKFFDVDASAYYYNAAIWAEQNGIVAGYPDGGFHPNDACTRAQIVTMLYNYIKG